MKAQIIPSILVPDAESFLQRYQAISASTNVAQLDVLDNSFLPYKSFSDPKFINRLRPRIAFEIHLMTKRLPAQIARWNFPWVKKIIFHLEAAKNPTQIIQLIKKQKKHVGIALNPETPAAAAKPYLKQINTVQVMTVHPGKNASPFLPQTLKKITQLRGYGQIKNICADGGINLKTAARSVKAGVNLLVVGSYLDNFSFAQNFKKLKNVIQ